MLVQLKFFTGIPDEAGRFPTLSFDAFRFLKHFVTGVESGELSECVDLQEFALRRDRGLALGC
jgi:hypothetical protein